MKKIKNILQKKWLLRIPLIFFFIATLSLQLIAQKGNKYSGEIGLPVYDLSGKQIMDGSKLYFENMLTSSEQNLGYLNSDPSSAIFRSGSFSSLFFFVDTGVLDTKINYSLEERYRKTALSKYVLLNNFLSGGFLSVMRERAFKLETVASFIDYNFSSRMFMKQDWETVSIGIDSARKESEMLYAAKLTTMLGKRGNLGITYANVSHVNAAGKNNLIIGAATSNYIPEKGINTLFLKIQSLAPEDLKSSAAFYGIYSDESQIVANNFPTSSSSAGCSYAIDNSGTQYLNISGEGWAIFRIDITNGAGLTEIKLKLKLANAFLVQLSPSGTFETYNPNFDGAMDNGLDRGNNIPSDAVLFSHQKIRDFSNLKLYTTSFGIDSSMHLASISLDLQFERFSFRGELAASLKYKRYPSVNGSAISNFTLAGNTEIALFPNDNLSFLLKGYYGAPDYSTTFRSLADASFSLNNFYAVTDNDNNDYWSPLFSLRYNHYDARYRETSETAEQFDLNRNGISDGKEPFLYFYSESEFFNGGFDLNHNNIPDQSEDDQRIDYPYDINLIGFQGFATYEPEKVPIKFQIITRKENRLTLSRANQLLLGNVSFNKKYRGRRETFSTLRLSGNLSAERVQDSIPNWVAPQTLSSRYYQKSGIDPLLYTDSVVIGYTLGFDMRDLRSFTARSRVKSVVNNQISAKNILIHDGAEFFLGWEYPTRLFDNKLIFSLRSKFELERVSIRQKELRILPPELERLKFFDTTFAVGPLLAYSLGSNTKITFAYQLTRNRFNYIPLDNYLTHNLGLELTLKGDYNWRNALLVTGVMFYSQEYEHQAGKDGQGISTYTRLHVKL